MKFKSKLLLVGIFVLGFQLFKLNFPSLLTANNLVAVKDTLQSSRISVAARVKSPTAVGSSHIYIYSSAAGSTNTVSTANLRPGDSIIITTHTYTIVNIINATEFNVSPVLLAGDATDTTPIYLKSTPQHVITFTTTSAQPNGFFRILLPGNTASGNDGVPDTTGFDFNSTVTVTAGTASGYNFVTGVSTPGGTVNCTAYGNYHCFEIHYTGSGGVGVPITINIGTTAGTNTPIAPAPSDTTEATGENYTYRVMHFDATSSQVDSSYGRIALIEAVRVTVTVDPSISFQILGVGTTSVCGAVQDVDTSTGINSPLAVPFGTLPLNTFKNAAHQLRVSTNAAAGYAVTAIANQPLGKDGSTAPYIVDTPCDTGPCTISTQQTWVTNTNSGFGYSLQNVNAASVAFSHGGIFNAKKFAAVSRGEAPQTLFSSSTIANAESAYICYRIAVNALQAAGDYENQIIYTATAVF